MQTKRQTSILAVRALKRGRFHAVKLLLPLCFFALVLFWLVDVASCCSPRPGQKDLSTESQRCVTLLRAQGKKRASSLLITSATRRPTSGLRMVSGFASGFTVVLPPWWKAGVTAMEMAPTAKWHLSKCTLSMALQSRRRASRRRQATAGLSRSWAQEPLRGRTGRIYSAADGWAVGWLKTICGFPTTVLLPFARHRIRGCGLPDFDPAIKGRCVKHC